MKTRLNLLDSLMDEARVVASRSKDKETKVGALLVYKDDYDTVATGYNGPIKDANDAKIPMTRPEKYPYMKHAEENIIAHCAKKGRATADTFLVITLSPCTNCLRLCWQAGIDTIFFLDKYRDFDKSANMLDLDVKTEDVFTSNYKLVKITLSPKP